MKNILGNLGRAAVVALVLMGSQAIGQTLYTYTITQSENFTVSGSGSTQTLDFTDFDTDLGTLTRVTLAIDNVVLSGTATITNQGSGTANYNMLLTGNYSLSDTAGNTATDTSTTYFPGPSSSDTVSLAVNQTYNPGEVSTAPVSHSTNYSTGNGDDLSPYEGNGTDQVSLTLNGTNTNTSTVNNGTYQVTSGLAGNGTVVVTYTYTTPIEAPEPSTWALMLVAGFGAAFVARRRLIQA